ncbi:MAG: hypothetical protein EBS01_15380, partial [Verrucomicrobia bacterium]|nr:hypothetical protein [Verrucomicrobiota bacterium]
MAASRLFPQASSRPVISATAGVAIDGFTFIATGTGRTYAAAGNLLGLTFSTNTGELSGIPTSVGTNNVTIDVTADE